MSRIKVGIPGWVIDNKMFGVTRPYAEFINKYGTMHVLAPDADPDPSLDLIVLPGGADIALTRYADNVIPSYYTGAPNPQLEYFDKHALPVYIHDYETPIIGICRGSQSIWQMFGGGMNQHNYTHKQSNHTKDECHELHWVKSEYADEYSNLILKVNSRHHQTMLSSEAPEELEVIAIAKEDNQVFPDIVEIFRHVSKPIFCYQSHPEDMPNDRLTDYVIEKMLTNQF